MKNLLYLPLLLVSFNCFSQTKTDSLSADEKKKIKRELILKQMQERKQRAEAKLGKKKDQSLVKDSLQTNDKKIFDQVLEKNVKSIETF